MKKEKIIMNQNVLCLSLIIFANVIQGHASRILVFIPTASVSHQVVTKGLSLELVRRGHEVVVITTNPIFTEGNPPTNLTEIDVREAGYAAKKISIAKSVQNQNHVLPQPISFFRHIFTDIFEAEIKTDQVQAVINDKKQKFDLLILEACTKETLIFSHIFKAPVILFSSLGNMDMFTDYTGAATHPLLFPTILYQKLYNLTLYEKAFEIYKYYMFENALKDIESKQYDMLKRNFGADIPSLRELKKNVAMVFLSEHHLWDNNRPVPPNMLYIGGIYPQRSTISLPKDIETYLNASINGVIYVSFGSTAYSSMLHPKIIQTIVKALAQLPFDVYLKWDTNDLPGLSKNVKIFQWVPQSEVLRHPKIKLFVTQGGMQSTDDAIAAGVPLIGLPMIADQWYNAEQYVRLKIGLKIDIESVTEEKLINSINTVINDDSYRRNMVALLESLSDQPQTALDRAVWWSEYVIRHKGAPHLRAPTALISNWEYYEVDLLLMVALWIAAIVVALTLSLYGLSLLCCRVIRKMKID